MKQPFFQRFPPFLASMATALFLYAVCRAFFTPFTYDESASWLYFKEVPYSEILNLKLATANNHVLHTLLLKYFGRVFGQHDFALRLPALLGTALYLFAALRIALLLSPKRLVQTSTFALLCLNPMLIEFFSLARGYSLSLGFELLALWGLLSWLEGERSVVKLLLTLGAAVLATLANFSAFVFLMALIGIFLLLLLTLKNSTQRNYSIAACCLIGIFSGIYFLPLLLKLEASHELYYGGKNGFFENTFRSLAAGILYRDNFKSPGQGQWLSMVLLVFWSGSALLGLLGWKEKAARPLLVFSLLSLLLSLIVSFLFYFKGTLLPQHRTALFLYPPLILPLAFCLQRISANNWPAARLLQIGLASALVLNFLSSANFTHVKNWPFELFTREALETLAPYRPQAPEAKVSLGANPYLAMSLEYYRLQKGLKWILPVPCERLDSSKHYQFMYLFAADSTNARQGYHKIQEWGSGKFMLVEYPDSLQATPLNTLEDKR